MMTKKGILAYLVLTAGLAGCTAKLDPADLQKIDAADMPTTHIKSGAAHMCIADPLGRRLSGHEGFAADLLATHPPMSKRIAILKGMGYAQQKRESGFTS